MIYANTIKLCIEVVNNERVSGETKTEEDAAYNRAIDDAISSLSVIDKANPPIRDMFCEGYERAKEDAARVSRNIYGVHLSMANCELADRIADAILVLPPDRKE